MGASITNHDVAERVAALMASHGSPCLVIGAVAMAAHRYVRYTEDIDLGADADLQTMREVAELLRLDGYRVELNEPDAEDPLGGVMNIWTIRFGTGGELCGPVLTSHPRCA